ncbi:MAG TPA: DUF1559 domain-containing protein [Pirellulales bacterium]|nr:DUF1559 domain-containing protein [Pirellulales bacterium]
MCRHDRSRGFTMIELMVVIVILGMLLALLIPAVQRARESGRRTQCANHSKEIGMAIIQFDMAKDRLPYLNTTLPSFGNQNVGSMNLLAGYLLAGWAPQILSQLGRDDLYQIYTSSSTTVWSIYNADGSLPGPPGNAFIQYLDTMVCPSDTAKPATYQALPTGVAASVVANAPAAAPLSYVVNAGCPDVFPVTNNRISYPPDYQENGLFFSQPASFGIIPNSGVALQQPVQTSLAYVGRYDGRGMTILLGENMDATFWAVFDQSPIGQVYVNIISFVPDLLYRYPTDNYQNVAGALVCPDSFEDPHALTWQDLPDMQGTATPGAPAVGLNQAYLGYNPSEQYQGLSSLGPGWISRPSSAHPGGFLLTYCDGHTAFMSQDAPYQIYAELMTPRGGWARAPGSGPVVQGKNPSTFLQSWQTAPVSDDVLNP